MPFYTPLRYPGGKRRLAPAVVRLLRENGLRDVEYAEPYAGGAGVALALLFEEHASKIHINDLSRPVYAFWRCVLEDSEDLCTRISKVRVTMAEWQRQRAVYDQRETAAVDDLGFAALFLNRTNRSGIIGGGVIGGQGQTGAWGLDARFNKEELIQRIKRVARYSSRIALYQLDASTFAADVVSKLGPQSFAFFDPPYIENSEDLYLNVYDINGHRALSDQVARLAQPWVVTYDYAAVRERLYTGRRRVIYGLNYSAQSRYQGREVMFISDVLRVPRDWTSTKPFSLARDKSEYPFYGKMENVKPSPQMEEGPAALERFRKAMKIIVAAPKQARPQKPRKKAKKQGRKA